MVEEYRHWRENMDMPYLRAENLAPGEVRILTIKRIAKEVMPKLPGKNNSVDEHQNVCYFEEDSLPMVLNVTNCQTIEQILETGNIDKWPGNKIAVYASRTTFGKKQVPCLRVKNFRPDKCAFCGKDIDLQIAKGSIAKYGKPYCSGECKDKDIKGEKIL